MRRQLRPFLIALAGMALALGLVSAPATAASSQASVSGRVVDAEGVGVRGLSVYAYKGDNYVDLGYTRNGGLFASNGYGDLRSGTWTFVASDEDEAPEYASVTRKVTLAPGKNAVADLVVPLGSNAEGVVTAPSGRKLRNVSLVSFPGDGTLPGEDGFFFEGIGFGTTNASGKFRLTGLGVGKQTMFAGFPESDEFPKSGKTFVVETPGQTVTGVDVTNLKVFPTVKITGTSPGKRKARLKLSVSAARYGIANPGGRFDLYLGTKKIRSAVGFAQGKRTVNLTGIGKGKRTFRFRYLGSTDTRSQWSKKIKVTIK